MSVLTRLSDDAVYFPPSTVGRDGQRSFGEPVAIKCDWLDSKEEFLDKNGGKQVSKAVVFVDQDVELLGVLWHGTIAELTSESEPFKNEGAYEIRKFDKVSRLRRLTEFVRVAYL